MYDDETEEVEDERPRKGSIQEGLEEFWEKSWR